MARITCKTPSNGRPLNIVAGGVGTSWTTVAEAPDFSVPDPSATYATRDPTDATRAIRALPGSGRDIPIIALSANAMRPEIELCHAAGMNGHLAKPVQQAALLESVALWSNPGEHHPPRDTALT